MRMDLTRVLSVFVLCVLRGRWVTGQGLYRTYDFTAAQQSMIINEHNKLRAVEPAMDMQEMIWDSNLAYMAKSWASQCIADHSSRSLRRGKYGYDRVGENIWWSDETFLRDDMTSVVRSFYQEKAYYYFESRACQSGQVCGHYTQVVWAQSCAVGCAAAYCANLVGGFSTTRPGHIVVCNYGPSGNFRGVAPYSYGRPCDACPLTCTSSRLCPSSCTRSQPVIAPPPAVQLQPQPAPPPATTTTASTTTTTVVSQQLAASASANSRCVDKNRLCSFWAKLCDGRPWMHENCYGSCNPQECGNAVTMDVGDCRDQNDNCAYWTSKGECTTNSKFMNWKCPRSCNQCQSG